MNPVLIDINLPQNFSFSEILTNLGRSKLELTHHIVDDIIYKIITVNEVGYLCEIQRIEGLLRVRIMDKTDEGSTLPIEDYIKNWFDLNQPLDQFYQLLASHNQFSYMTEQYQGVRLVGIPNLFECLCWCVIGQQINLHFAHQVKARLVKHCGRYVEADGIKVYDFPLPAEILNIEDEVLFSFKFSRSKIKYIKTVAEGFENQEIKFDQLNQLPTAEILDELLKIKGIGPWTANYALMKTFRRMDAIPYGDSGLRAALKKHGFRADTKVEIDKAFFGFEGWKSYLSFYLWRSLDD